MKLSVLLPISNNSFQSYDAIDSVLNQDYKNYELLICLNGNSAKFDKKIRDKYCSCIKCPDFKCIWRLLCKIRC